MQYRRHFIHIQSF